MLRLTTSLAGRPTRPPHRMRTCFCPAGWARAVAGSSSAPRTAAPIAEAQRGEIERNLELHTGRELEGAGAAGAEHLAGAGRRLPVAELVQNAAVAGQVGHVEEVEDLADEVQAHALSQHDAARQADVLGHEGVAARE